MWEDQGCAGQGCHDGSRLGKRCAETKLTSRLLPLRQLREMEIRIDMSSMLQKRQERGAWYNESLMEILVIQAIQAWQ